MWILESNKRSYVKFLMIAWPWIAICYKHSVSLQLCVKAERFLCHGDAPISSMKMMQGWILTAREKTAAVSFWDSPYHLSVRMEGCRFIKRHPEALAVAFPIRVFPQPGGPYSSTPAQETQEINKHRPRRHLKTTRLLITRVIKNSTAIKSQSQESIRYITLIDYPIQLNTRCSQFLLSP